MKNFNKKVIPIHQIGFPIDLEIMIPKNDSVRLLYEVTEGLNYSELYKAYATIGRNPAISPKSLFKIIIYGYMEGIYSSRDLEKACKRDVNFRWLLEGQSPPEHNTFARFKSERLSNCIEDLFSQFIKKLREINEIKYENIFIDGTKIEANANRYSFVWKKSTDKFESKLQEKIRKTLETSNLEMDLNIVIPEGKIVVDFINTVLENLITIKDKENIEFVYGKGKRKSKLQRLVESLEEFVEKQTKYDDYTSIFDGRNSFSKTDHDATFMHMKEDHMKNGQLKPGYNIQIGVEGEYIVGVDVSSERSDQLTLIPFLDRLESNIGCKYNSVTADAGYESGENYTYLENNNQIAYIKPQTYEKSKTIKFKKDISKRENMIYNEDEDYYICAAGKKLSVIGTRNKKSKSGFNSIITVYECENCYDCQYKSNCSKAKGNKQLYVSKDFIRQRENSLINITTPEGKILRMNRSIQVKGAFGVLKEDYGFRRFLMRGKKNIRIEFLLLSFGYNINKLYNKTVQNRNGQLLHLKEVS